MKWSPEIWKRVKQFVIHALEDKETKADTNETANDNGALVNLQPGLVCPECSYKIAVSIDMLLSGSPIVCPSCELKLNIEKEASKPVLDKLRKLDTVIKNASKKHS